MKRVVIVGSGWVANYRHIPILKSLKVVIVGIVNHIDPNEAKTTIAEHNCGKFLQLEDLKDLNFDTLIILTPPEYHYQYLEIGLNLRKQIICEKPIVAKLTEFEQLSKKQLHDITMINNFSHTKPWQKLLGQLSNQEITGIRLHQQSSVNRKFPAWLAHDEIDIFLDEGVHYLYLLSELGLCEWTNYEKKNNLQIITGSLEGEIPIFASFQGGAATSKWEIIISTKRNDYVYDIFLDHLYILGEERNNKYEKYFSVMSKSRQFLDQTVKQFLKKVLGRRLYFGLDRQYEQVVKNQYKNILLDKNFSQNYKTFISFIEENKK